MDHLKYRDLSTVVRGLTPLVYKQYYDVVQIAVSNHVDKELAGSVGQDSRTRHRTGSLSRKKF